MKILENKQVRGILVGVVFGLIAAFTLQAFDVALWLCLGAGLLLGLEAGYFAAAPRKTLAAHRDVIDKVNFELHLPKINWLALKPSWTWKQARKVVGDVAVTILGIGIVAGYVLAAACCMSALSTEFSWEEFCIYSAVIIGMCGAIVWMMILGAENMYTHEPRKIPFNGLYFKCKTYRQRVLFRCVVGPIAGALVINALIAWILFSICLAPVYGLAAVCKLARRHENAVVTVGIVAGVITGFIFGYAQDFVLTMELLACAIGSVAGLFAGALVVLGGRVADWCMDAYLKITVWLYI